MSLMVFDDSKIEKIKNKNQKQKQKEKETETNKERQAAQDTVNNVCQDRTSSNNSLFGNRLP